MKKIVIIALPAVFLLIACQENQIAYSSIQGQTMGTTYHISYESDKQLKKSIDSLLEVVNMSMSTYIENSSISKLNNALKETVVEVDDHFNIVYTASLHVNKVTDGAFDPSIMPILRYWGFGTSGKTIEEVDSGSVDSLKQLVGFEKFSMIYSKSAHMVSKSNSGSMLDFSAIAKGYGVDVIGKLIEGNGIPNYMVEIGGEVRCRGINASDKSWSIGINKPSEDEDEAAEFQDIFVLNDKSVATSGNYRNFKVIEGKKFGHTVNPNTGFPEQSNLLSVTVFAEDCMTADAYATAFMVLGLNKSLKIVNDDSELDAYFIYVDSEGAELKTAMTEGAMMALYN